MTFGQLRNYGVNASLGAGWALLHSAWCTHWQKLQRFTWGVDAPELYTERSFVGQWATAMASAYPQIGLALIERPVQKATATANGFLDLWLAVCDGNDDFDYAIEAKPHVVTALNTTQAATVFDLASDELSAIRTLASTQIARYSAGAALGIVSRNEDRAAWKAGDLDAFEDMLWQEVQNRLAQSTTATGAVLATCAFTFGDFNKWNSRVPFGAYGLFLIAEENS